jgi:hypothetical protein
MADSDTNQEPVTRHTAPPRAPQRKATLRLHQRHLTYISAFVVLVVVVPLIYGLYKSFLGFKAQRDTVIAQDNLFALYKAIKGGYSPDNDEKLPPADQWTDVAAGYLSAPPNKPGGKLSYLHGPGDDGDVGYVYNDLASNYELEPKQPFPGVAQPAPSKSDKPRVDPDRLILLIEKPGAQPNEHEKIPPPDSIQNQEELYKLLAFPHNHDDPDGAKTVILYASGKIDIVTRKDLRP